MFNFKKKANRTRELEAVLSAVEKSQAVIEFDMEGKIQNANENFLSALGYKLDEVLGKHHSIFVDPNYRESPEYKRFWSNLRDGKYDTAEYKRRAKDGHDVWIQASYNPIMDEAGKPVKVVKFATEVTDQKTQNADYAGQIAAISKSQAVIEFNMDGTIITANENFLRSVGYSLEEIKGKHHSMFVEPFYRDGFEYREFWNRLRDGNYQSGEYKRVGNGGKEIWIQASYNPILDLNGHPFKVVKFATDVTQQKLQNANYAGQIAAINKSQAVIEFNMDGTIITANENFLNAMGYTLQEIQGQHHSLFVMPGYRDSAEYREFWNNLRAGQYQSAEYLRLGKGGREVWIQASYNPIFDLNNKPYKVVKFASDVTKQVSARKNISGMLQSVAAGAEELNASVREIAEAMVKSKDIANAAYEKVENADQTTQRLTEVTKSMDTIVGTISSIAGQINLLALNATIESARAGEAGRGFAVVANEVKNLAGQAKNATHEITAQIEGMRVIFGDIVGGLGTIKGSIEQVREYVTSTSAAVEEQSAVANEMSSSTQNAATEAANIA